MKLVNRQSSLPWLTVVGVVESIRQDGVNDPFSEFYTPFTQEHQRWAKPSILFIRAAGDPGLLIEAVKREVWAVNKDQTISAVVHTMDEILARWLAPRRFNLWLLGVFASLALVLASVGDLRRDFVRGQPAYARVRHSNRVRSRAAGCAADGGLAGDALDVDRRGAEFGSVPDLDARDEGSLS